MARSIGRSGGFHELWSWLILTGLQSAWCGLQIDRGGALDVSRQWGNMDGTTSFGHIRGWSSGNSNHSRSRCSNNCGSGVHNSGSGLNQNGSSWRKGKGHSGRHSRGMNSHRTGWSGSTNNHWANAREQLHHGTIDSPGQGKQDYDNGELQERIKDQLYLDEVMIHFAPVAHLHVAYVNCATIETLLIDICHISRAYILSKFP